MEYLELMRGNFECIALFRMLVASVCVGSTLAMITNEYISNNLPGGPGDAARMAAQVISGIGFLGAGFYFGGIAGIGVIFGSSTPESKFIGLENYVSMFKNADLWQSLKNNAVYFLVHLCMIPVELAFAVLLVSKLKAAKFYKTMVFMPYIINGVAIAYAFSYFFSPINGAFDAILEVLHLEMLSRNWLSDTKIVNFVLSFVSVWRFSGYYFGGQHIFKCHVRHYHCFYYRAV